MKSNESAPPVPRLRRLTLAILLALLKSAILVLLASCSSLGKPEQQRSSQPPACEQRTAALDGGDPPASTDWMEWAQAWVKATYAIVDRDNKRAATADCLDAISRIKP